MTTINPPPPDSSVPRDGQSPVGQMDRLTDRRMDGSLLGDLAVCRGDVAAGVVDVAAHHVVGEVRLQDDVFGVHLDLSENTMQK